MTDLSRKDLPLPEQTEGTKKDIQESITLFTAQEAQAAYGEAKSRLLDVNRWSELCGDASAVFELTDEQGRQVWESPRKGYYFKINIPGPGTASGKGFDWVQVEAVNEKGNSTTDTEYIIVRVRPASDPTTPNTNVAHFFSEKATSNFLVLREGTKLTAAVLGRNEVANTDEDDSLLDKIRNFIVGQSAKLGMADQQWKSLVQGILGRKEVS